MQHSKFLTPFRHFNRFYANLLARFAGTFYNEALTMTEANVLIEIQQNPHNGVFELGEADAPMFAEFVAWVKGLLVYNLDFSQYTDSLGVRFAIAG